MLYDGYGFSVASLYCLGFLTGAVTSPITGPLIDKFGRKTMTQQGSAMKHGNPWAFVVLGMIIMLPVVVDQILHGIPKFGENSGAVFFLFAPPDSAADIVVLVCPC